MFSYDHKAGITAATKALRELYGMKNFKPALAVKIIDSIAQIKEDFRLQTAATRLLIYELLLDQVRNPDVSKQLKQHYGASYGFVADLLQLSQHERDPQNLMVWFGILQTLLAEHSLSPEVVDDIFKAFSAYFPITLRSSAAPAGVTAEDLKGALRGCFSAHGSLAPLAFPFLLQKLNQGDAVTVAVKVDILKTIQACVDKYDQAQDSVVPHIRQIWDSLKYEVRNGEVKETIEATLDVLRAISNRMQMLAASLTGQHLDDYVKLVVKDCGEDFSNPIYAKQSGLLVNTIVTANIRAFILGGRELVNLVDQNLQHPKSPSHQKDLVALLNLYLKSRLGLLESTPERQLLEDSGIDEEKLREAIDRFFLPFWRSLCTKSDVESVNILKEVVQGLALFVSQKASLPALEGRPEKLFLPAATCEEICSLLSARLLEMLTLSANDNANAVLQEEVVLALRTIVMHYAGGYGSLVGKVMKEIRSRTWDKKSPYSLDTIRSILTKLAFIGCSEIPRDISLSPPPSRPYSALQHFITLVGDLSELLTSSMTLAGDNPQMCSVVIVSVHCAMLNLRDACRAKYGPEALEAYAKGDENWTEEFRDNNKHWLPNRMRHQPSDLPAIRENEPEIYYHFLKLCLYTVRLVYRQLHQLEMSSERVLSHVASMAAFVVRSLDERLQKSCHLAEEAFDFFLEPEAAKDLRGGEFLTMGILQGLWPGAMTNLVR